MYYSPCVSFETFRVITMAIVWIIVGGFPSSFRRRIIGAYHNSIHFADAMLPSFTQADMQNVTHCFHILLSCKFKKNTCAPVVIVFNKHMMQFTHLRNEHNFPIEAFLTSCIFSSDFDRSRRRRAGRDCIEA